MVLNRFAWLKNDEVIFIKLITNIFIQISAKKIIQICMKPGFFYLKNTFFFQFKTKKMYALNMFIVFLIFTYQ